jgi:hypothetical protein
MEAGGIALLSRTVAGFTINGIEVLLPPYQFALKSVSLNYELSPRNKFLVQQ